MVVVVAVVAVVLVVLAVAVVVVVLVVVVDVIVVVVVAAAACAFAVVEGLALVCKSEVLLALLIMTAVSLDILGSIISYNFWASDWLCTYLTFKA